MEHKNEFFNLKIPIFANICALTESFTVWYRPIEFHRSHHNSIKVPENECVRFNSKHFNFTKDKHMFVAFSFYTLKCTPTTPCTPTIFGRKGKKSFPRNFRNIFHL